MSGCGHMVQVLSDRRGGAGFSVAGVTEGCTRLGSSARAAHILNSLVVSVAPTCKFSVAIWTYFVFIHEFIDNIFIVPTIAFNLLTMSNYCFPVFYRFTLIYRYYE